VLDETLELSSHVRRVLVERGVEVRFVCSLQELDLSIRAQGMPDMTVVSLTPALTAWQLAQQLKSLGVPGPTLVLFDARSAHGLEHLLKIPGVECVERPAGPAAVETALAQFLGRPGRGGHEAPPATAAPRWGGIVGQSRELGEVLAKIEKVAPGDANVCIVGESGTGKELIARAIHYNSPRRDRPLVTLDCTAVPEGLMESHLFGHLRGSFTGAVENRDGVFSLAHTGTLFIDEISELSLPLQAKLLRVIQTREFVKVGGSKAVRTDIRLITASNRDLRRAVQDGAFREDLYYRVAVVMLQVPALRERRGDIPVLADHFLRKFSAAHRKPLPALTTQAMELLTTYEWPGNVRQLENCLEQAVVLCDRGTIDVDVLPLAEPTRAHASAGEPPPVGLTLRELEQQHILRTLRAVGGNRTRAARMLGISLRCLQYKLKAYSQGGVEFDSAAEREHSLGVQP
jgi:DNA-binding NtrC family response regulator